MIPRTMCNAWNHPLGCNCGWGGVNYGTYEQGKLENPFSSQLQDLVTRSSSDENDAKTFLTSCPWCDDDVYYHTNGYGDSVYFDNLGYPWQVHECFKNYWESKKANNKKELGQTKNQSLSRDFFTISEDQQKRLILIGAARRISNAIVGQFLIYKTTEFGLAKQLGITVQQLKEFYGHLYNQEISGLKVFSQEELEQKKQILTSKALKSEVPSSFQPKPQTRLVTKYQNLNATKAINSSQFIACSNCHQKVRKGELQRHINKQCKAIESNQLIPCPNCHQSVRQYNLQKHIDKQCKAIESNQLVLCPNCHQSVLSNHLEEHISKNCNTVYSRKKRKATHSKSSIISCPICHLNVRSDDLINHIVRFCPKYQKMMKNGV